MEERGIEKSEVAVGAMEVKVLGFVIWALMVGLIIVLLI